MNKLKGVRAEKRINKQYGYKRSTLGIPNPGGIVSQYFRDKTKNEYLKEGNTDA